MNKINVGGWRRYHLYDLFDIDSGTKLDKAKMDFSSEDVNFVGRANINNGITAKIRKIKDVIPYEAGNLTLALGGEYLGSCFIQSEPFYTSQNVIVLKPKKEYSYYSKCFISTVIFKEGRTYYKAFVDELNRHVKTDFSFLLPTKNNEPDWNYMEDYMKEKEILSIKKIDKLTNKISKEKHLLDSTLWKDFKIKDFCELVKDKSQVPTGSNIKQSNLEEGNIPRVSVSGINNGIIGKYKSDGKGFNKYKNFISVSFLGSVFYQPEETSLDMKVHCVKPKNISLNDYTGTYLATAIKQSLYKYAYSDQISSTLLPEIVVKLPTKNNEPDWNYMEDYMKEKERLVINKINKLTKGV